MSDWMNLVIILSIVVGIGFAISHYFTARRSHKRVGDDANRGQLEESHTKNLGTLVTGLTFLVPLAWTAVQFAYTQQADQRRADRVYLQDLRTGLSSTIKAYEQADTSANMRIQAIYELERTAILAKQTKISTEETPTYYITAVADLLMREIRKLRQVQVKDGEKVDMYVSRDCGAKQESTARNEKEIEKIRDEHYLLQAALGSLGRLREQAEFTTRLYSVRLDNMDAIKGNFAGSDFNHSHLRLTNFFKSNFEGASFRNAVLADFMVPGWSKEIVASMYGDEWKKLQCWVANFRETKLMGVDFREAKLDGADFRGAKFNDGKKKAIFAAATLDRADFGETDITGEQLCAARNWDESQAPYAPSGLTLKCGRKIRSAAK